MDSLNVNSKSGSSQEIKQLKEQETSLRSEISSSQAQQSSTQNSSAQENSMVDMQLSENSNASASASASLSGAQNSQSSAQGQLSGAVSAESEASNNKNTMDSNQTTAENNVSTADSAYAQAENQVGSAENSYSSAESSFNAAQTNVSGYENDVSNAESRARAEESKSWLDGVKNFISSIWETVKNLKSKLAEARQKLQEAFGAKANAAENLESAKNASVEAKNVLEDKKTECDKAKELAWAAQIILEAKTGAREVSEQELDAAIQIVAEAQEEESRLQAEGQNLQAQKTEIREKYDALLAEISNLISEKEVSLADVISKIAELQSKADKDSKDDTGQKDGELVVDYAKQYMGKSQADMKKIMTEKNYPFHKGAWCADFVNFVTSESIKGKRPDWYENCDNLAYCPTIDTAGSAAGAKVSVEQAKPGDIVLFEFDDDDNSDHIGIFQTRIGNKVYTLEGNTTYGNGSQAGYKIRDISEIKNIYSMKQ